MTKKLIIIVAPKSVYALWQLLATILLRENISAIFVGLDIARSIISKLSILNMPV